MCLPPASSSALRNPLRWHSPWGALPRACTSAGLCVPGGVVFGRCNYARWRECCARPQHLKHRWPSNAVGRINRTHGGTIVVAGTTHKLAGGITITTTDRAWWSSA